MNTEINTSNRIELLATHVTLEMLGAGILVAGGSCAGSVLAPIGAVGGALFGATSSFIHSWARCCKRIFNLDDPEASLVAKVVFFAIELFAMAGSGMLALTLAGFTITVGSALSLALLSTIGIAFIKNSLEYCYGDLKKPVTV